MRLVLAMVLIGVAVVGCTTNGDAGPGAVVSLEPTPIDDDSGAPAPSGHPSALPATEDTAVDASTSTDASTREIVDSGHDAEPVAPPACTGYAAPTVVAACRGCFSSIHACQRNGCYGGYWCELGRLRCVARPSTC